MHTVAMRIHRFFVPQVLPREGDFIVSNKDLLNQWRNVLRMAEGDKITAFDGSGDEALCEFHALDAKSATLSVVERRAGLAPSREVTLFMSLIKRDNFELVLEKATELGVSRIVPIEAARSEKKGTNRDRTEKILREATEQSGRATVPTLDEVVSLQDVFKKYQIPLVAFDPRGEKNAREHFNANTIGPIGVVIGPEGGFTEDELALFSAHDVPLVATGHTILRAETAAIVALALALV